MEMPLLDRIVNFPASWFDGLMNTSSGVAAVNSYKGHRFPAEIISHCVWLYFRFSLSFRDVEEMMAERGVTSTGAGIE
ncbi:MAG: hypothetical protein WCA45_11170 [Thiobacillaceae bacterium]